MCEMNCKIHFLLGSFFRLLFEMKDDLSSSCRGQNADEMNCKNHFLLGSFFRLLFKMKEDLSSICGGQNVLDLENAIRTVGVVVELEIIVVIDVDVVWLILRP